MGKYQVEGTELLAFAIEKFCFFVAQFQAVLDTKDLYVDIKYTRNSGFSYLLNMVAFNDNTI